MAGKVKNVLRVVAGPTGGWKRTSVVLALGLAIAGGFAVAEPPTKPDTIGLEVQPIEINATPIAGFNRDNPGDVKFGALEWRGGLVLTSPSPNFGGLSGLVLGTDGTSFLTITDAGAWIKGTLRYDGVKVAGIEKASIGPLRSRNGKILGPRRDRDAEAIVLESGTLDEGSLLIAFEQNDRIGRFPLTAGGIAPPSGYIQMPPEAKAMKVDGLEAVTVLTAGPYKGSVVAIAERAVAGDQYAGWVWIAGKPRRFAIAESRGFDVTDITSFDDGDLLVLERRFRWSEGVKVRLRRVSLGDLKPGAKVASEILLEADMSREIDNMEGLAVHTGAAGETVITMLSDDNFNRLIQRTVLLQFTLRADADGPAAGPPATAAVP